METKLLGFDSVEFKMRGERKFAGYASVFNGVDSYGDMIMPGAYSDTIKNRARPIRMRWNHYGPVIGKWTRIEEDGKGLYVEGELTPDHSVADDVYASMKFGAVDGMSIGYRIPSGGSEKDGKIRRLKKIDLIEISAVEEPADLGAKVSDVKSAIDAAQSLGDLESILREAGFSKADALGLVARIKMMSRSESDDSRKCTANDFAGLLTGSYLRLIERV